MSELIVTQRHGEIVEIVLNRPEAYNAFNLEMLTQLAEQLTHLATDATVKGIAIVGRGKAFSAGGDLKWATQFSDDAASALHRLASYFHLAILEIRRMEKPVVAAINGVAAGGGFSLALACDFRIMAQSAILRQSYTSSGLSMDGGGTFSLPRLVGLARALEIAAFDPPISSAQALEWGLVTRVAPDEVVLEEAMGMLQQLARTALHSFGWSKRLLTDSFNVSLETQLELERQGLCDCARHPNGQEGVKAFLEKRKPVF